MIDDDWTPLPLAAHPSTVADLSVSADGRYAAATDWDGGGTLFTLPAAGIVERPQAERLPGDRHFQSCWVGDRLVSGGTDGRVRLFQPGRRSLGATAVRFENVVGAIASAPIPEGAGEGWTQVYAVSPAGVAGRYDLSAGRAVWDRRGGSVGGTIVAMPRQLAPVPGGRRALYADSLYGLRGVHGLVVLDAADGRELARHALPGSAFALLPLAEDEAFLVLRDSETERLELHRWSGGAVRAVGDEADETIDVASAGAAGVAYGTRDGAAKLLEPDGGGGYRPPRTVARMPGEEQVNAVAATPDTLLFAGSEGTLIVLRRSVSE